MATAVKDVSGQSSGKKAGGILDRGKSLIQKTKERVFEYALGEALGLLGHASEQRYVHIAQLFKSQAKNETGLMVARWVENYLSPGSPGPELIKRVLTSVDPKVRRKYLARFISSILFHDSSVVHKLPDGREASSPACVVISPTMRCNLRCVGCYAGNYTKKDDMPAWLFERVISEARELGTRFFIVVGGEPLIYEPLLDVLKKFDDCAFQFYTSGHLLTDEVARRIVDMGNTVPAVSIEGFKKETDMRRGDGGFDRAIRAMDILRKAHALFAFSVTVTRQNFDAVTSDEFVDLMIEKGAGYGWYFTYVPIGRGPDMDLQPTPEQRMQLRVWINEIRKVKPMLIGDFWNDGPLSEGCLSAGRRYLHINNKGDVEPCVFAHFAVDNLHSTSLKEALASDFFTAWRQASPFGANLLRPCPIIDHPQVLRKLVKKFGAYPTHEGAESIITDLAESMDRYAARLKEVSDPVWDAEYQWAAVLHNNPRYAKRLCAPENGGVSRPDEIVVDGEPCVPPLTGVAR
ncbi:MAG: radical SAM protein [Chloroflexi bacterium]|nr:radical SAM protein [Chloroflexota bacterium]